MQTLRMNALHQLFSNSKFIDVPESKTITSFFGENVFELKKARDFMSGEAYRVLFPLLRIKQK